MASTRRRLIVLSATSLILGAAVNLGVAFVCALSPISQLKSVDYRLDSIQNPTWFATFWRQFGACRIKSELVTEEARALVRSDPEKYEKMIVTSRPWWSRMSRAPETASPGYLLEDARGWPLPSLRCSWRWGVTEGVWSRELRGGIAWPQDGGRHIAQWRAIPTAPIYAGLIANSLLYALAIGCSLAAFRGARRAIRRARNCCTACGYPIASARCPECGEPTPAGQAR